MFVRQGNALFGCVLGHTQTFISTSVNLVVCRFFPFFDQHMLRCCITIPLHDGLQFHSVPFPSSPTFCFISMVTPLGTLSIHPISSYVAYTTFAPLSCYCYTCYPVQDILCVTFRYFLERPLMQRTCHFVHEVQQQWYHRTKAHKPNK